MAHAPDIKVRLRAAYIGGLPLEAAAAQAGVPYPTARNWYNAAKRGGDDWDKFQKASLIVAGGGIEQSLGRIIAAGLLRCETLLETSAAEQNIGESVKTAALLGDTVAKLKAASRGLMPEADKLAVAMEVVKRLGELVRTRYPRHAGAFAEILEPFADELAKLYG